MKGDLFFTIITLPRTPRNAGETTPHHTTLFPPLTLPCTHTHTHTHIALRMQYVSLSVLISRLNLISPHYTDNPQSGWFMLASRVRTNSIIGVTSGIKTTSHDKPNSLLCCCQVGCRLWQFRVQIFSLLDTSKLSFPSAVTTSGKTSVSVSHNKLHSTREISDWLVLCSC